MFEIVYTSLATHDLSASELSALLDQARTANQARGITGMMIYHKREFLQLIEGEEAQVQALYERIERDERHQQMSKIWDAHITERSFGAWEMALVTPDNASLQNHPGYRDLMDLGPIAASGGSIGKKLLLNLRDDFLGAR